MITIPRLALLGAAVSLLTVVVAAQPAASSDTTSVDRAISDEIAQTFGGDRAAFLRHLRQQEKTLREYRADVAARLESGRPVEEVRVRLIELRRQEGEDDVGLRARAERTVLARLRAGESFATLARELSEARASAPKGGDLGWLKREHLTASSAATIFGLAPGRASEPLVTPSGCCVFLVEERR